MVALNEHEWLTVPDLAERLSLPLGKVRRMLEERQLLGTRVDGVLKVPAEFLRENEPVHELRGTIIVLADNGFSDEEAIDWLLGEDEVLGARPIDALRAGRKAEVRRVAQALA
ncbi:MAG TPA: Rv2175c family DNA-binding protein [Naasia sp.]